MKYSFLSNYLKMEKPLLAPGLCKSRQWADLTRRLQFTDPYSRVLNLPLG